MTTSAKESEVSLAITVEQDAEAQLPEVTLVRILVALLDNAVQHSPPAAPSRSTSGETDRT